MLESGVRPEMAELARALDALACAFHEAPAGWPADTDREPPAFTADVAALQMIFPEFTWYPVADIAREFDQSVMLADLIDDLGDIWQDQQEFIWRYENLGEADAHWHFRLLFGGHWGRHLRQLSLYLHSLQFR